VAVQRLRIINRGPNPCTSQIKPKSSSTHRPRIYGVRNRPRPLDGVEPEEHYGLEYDTPDNRPREGATFHQAEEVAGMYADLHGRFQYIDHQVAVWAGTAYYPLLRGLVTVRIPEGGTIRLEETEDGTRMSHAVWMDFPNNRRGRALKWVFTTALGGKAKLYDHTNRELVFFKDRIESAAPENRSR